LHIDRGFNNEAKGFSIIENALKAYFNGVEVATVTFTSNDYNNTFG
jgi:hypothetical protein